jgi:4-amino-4-deoxy-L-arabinose transferase-like glycosyltransferase
MPAIRRDHILICIVFIVLTISTVAWTLANQMPPSWDPADHIRTAYDFYHPLSQGRFGDFLHDVFQARHAYGPLFHWFTAGIFLVAGVSRVTAIAANVIALAILLLSVNSIGNRLHPVPSGASSPVPILPTGAIAALLVAGYHFPAWLIHEAFLDYLLMAMVALVFALLMRADEFQVRADAVVLGIAAGLGMLAKQTFLFFFIIPGIALLIRALTRRDRKAIANLFLSVAIAVLIASIWYIPHIDDVIGIYQVNSQNAAVESEAPPYSFRFIAYYWGVLVGLQIQLVFGLLFVVGVTYSIRRRRMQDWMLYLWILSGILSFTLIANKDARYTVPILPAVALLSVSWFSAVRIHRRLTAAALITLWSLVTFLNAQWPTPRLDFRLRALGTPLYFLSGNVFRFDHRPISEDWSVPELVSAASGKLGIVPNLWQLNPSNIGLYARIHNPRVNVLWLSEDLAGNRLERCDYVLARTNLESAMDVSTLERTAADDLPYQQVAVLYKRLQSP